MDNNPWDEADIAISSWSPDTSPTWPTTVTSAGQVWLQGDAPWDPSTIVPESQDSSEQDITAQDQRGISQLSSLAVTEPSATGASVLDHRVARSTPSSSDSFDPVPETTDAVLHNIASVARVSDEEDLGAAPDNDWGMAWGNTPSSEANPKETQPPDQWEVARQEKEKLNRAVPPEFLDSLLRHCQQVSQDLWPAPETSNEDNWRSGFDDLADITALLAQLVPADSALPPIVQFPATATAKAMNEALKLTRHLPTSASSPLSRLLASKGSLEWEKSIKVGQDVVPDMAHTGWRVLEKEDRLSTVEESKPRKATSGLLSFWNRRASSIQAAPVETPSRRSSPSARSSLESVKSVPHPLSSQAASPPNASTPSVPPPPPPDVVVTASAPSAVSRFLNRFSRMKGAQHSSLALSSDDLEFLSDIVPSASDPPDEGINDSALDALTGANNSSPLPPKLPPPIPPPSKQSILSSRSTSALGLGTLDGVNVIGSVNHTPNVPVLVPPLSPKPAASFSRTQCPPLSLKHVATTPTAFGQSSTPSIQPGLQPSSQVDSQPHSSFTLPLHQKVPPLLSIPPLLPPPPVSPPQTPRPSAFPSMIAPSHSSTMRSTDTSSFPDSYDSDDEFTAFKSFPPSAPPFPSLDSYPSRRSPSPPSPPPHRTYERTHYPSSSSASSILSPASQTSVDQLCSTRSSISASLDSFDDFVSPPSVVRGENRKRTTSPPLLSIKPQSQHWQPPRIDTLPSRVYHAHTPSQTFVSPTDHTSLMNSAFSVPSVSNAEHQRTQSLVNHAAARGGLLWPNSPKSDEKVNAIPPPSSPPTSPKSSIGEESFDLLGDSDTLNGGLVALPAPLNVVGGIGMGSMVSSPMTVTLRPPFEVAGGPGKRLGSRNQQQPSPPPLPSTSTPILTFSSLGTSLPSTASNTGLLQPTKPKQTGGLSAQDLSFFEGL
ncbi:hypothetical protein J3R83DRAFT_8289 [Lanmaoa asiatica]|nr:hypothetical protein J3R83DRAFT_8289 [Lanmaoa asiatica]